MIPIPLRDNQRRELWPLVTLSLVVLNVLLFLFELSLGPRLAGFIQMFGVIPVRYMGPGGPFSYGLEGLLLPPFVSMFLHGGWGHLLSNMLFLWVFGRSMEDKLGHGRFAYFYLACGLGAGLTHIVLNPLSTIPTVGASGAIAGVLGAYLLSFPRAKITILIPLFIFFWSIHLPAYVVLGYWFLIQFASGWQVLLIAPSTEGGVAWWAHVGGFVFGFLLGVALPARKRKRRIPLE